jgi:hypothetical protein
MTTHQATAVDPYGDGQIGRFLEACGSDHVEIEAILGELIPNVIATVTDAVLG